jgi:hypothetical protein
LAARGDDADAWIGGHAPYCDAALRRDVLARSPQ